ncbi:MAG TPA: LPS export ABC transporter permease LptF [Caulobacteraceae bacterium]|nr:LPS export ABC transporter permease LptF [Caulobacteraceae bacterium]
MILLERYLLRQLLIPTLLALAALTVVAFLSQSLSALSLIVDDRQSLIIFLKVTVLALPELVSLILPVAVFVAAAIALNRMHTEHEIVVCFAGGMSRWDVISPAMRLAGFAVMASLALNLWVAPPASQALRTTIYDARADLATNLIKGGDFSEPSPGLTVYAQSANPNGLLKNVFVHQQRANGSTTFSADTGQITKRGDAPMLIMRHGASQEFSASGVLNYLAFDEYALDLSAFISGGDDLHFKTSDRYMHELVFPDLTQPWERQYRKKMLSEAASRLSGPLYNIAFMAIALAAVIGGSFTRLGYNRRIISAAAVAAAVRLLGFAAQAFAAHAVWMNVFQLIVPVAAAAIALHRLFTQRHARSSKPRWGALSLAGART